MKILHLHLKVKQLHTLQGACSGPCFFTTWLQTELMHFFLFHLNALHSYIKTFILK